MTNFATYESTKRFWELIEEAGVEGPDCEFYWYSKWWTNEKYVGYRSQSGYGRSDSKICLALDCNALLSWDWLTKPRVKNTEPHNFDFNRMGAWRACHRYLTRHESKLYLDIVARMVAVQALTDYAILLLEHELQHKGE